MEPKCKNCRFWKGHDMRLDGRIAFEAFQDEYGCKSGKFDSLTSLSGYECEEIEMDAEFGCICFEPKEAK